MAHGLTLQNTGPPKAFCVAVPFKSGKASFSLRIKLT